MKKLRVSYTTVSRAVKQAEKRGVEMSNVRHEPEIYPSKTGCVLGGEN
jgi:hypothetical protein